MNSRVNVLDFLPQGEVTAYPYSIELSGEISRLVDVAAVEHGVAPEEILLKALRLLKQVKDGQKSGLTLTLSMRDTQITVEC